MLRAFKELLGGGVEKGGGNTDGGNEARARIPTAAKGEREKLGWQRSTRDTLYGLISGKFIRGEVACSR